MDKKGKSERVDTVEYVWCEVFKQECRVEHNVCFLQLTGNEECLQRLSECLDAIQDIVEEYSPRAEEAWMAMSLVPIKESTVLDLVKAVPCMRVFRGKFTFNGDPSGPPESLAEDLSGELYYGDGFPYRLLVGKTKWLSST